MPVVTISPTESDVQTALRTFLLSILPAGVQVVEGQDNLVAEPDTPDYVVMTPILRNRIGTSINTYVDNTFWGSITAGLLALPSPGFPPSFVPPVVGSPIYGPGVALGTVVTGTVVSSVGLEYTVSPSQTIAYGPLASGFAQIMNPTQLTIQCDVHGPNGAENSQIISTLLRDNYGTWQFGLLNPNICPLHADDSQQMPFVNAENQIEDRWVVTVVLQVNQTVTVTGQQFATQVIIELLDANPLLYGAGVAGTSQT